MLEKKSGNFADLDYSGYHPWIDDDGEKNGSLEVFIVPNPNWSMDQDAEFDPGWYYWSCFPGCLPDSDPIGPFLTSADAYHDAQGY